MSPNGSVDILPILSYSLHTITTSRGANKIDKDTVIKDDKALQAAPMGWEWNSSCLTVPVCIFTCSEH